MFSTVGKAGNRAKGPAGSSLGSPITQQAADSLKQGKEENAIDKWASAAAPTPQTKGILDIWLRGWGVADPEEGLGSALGRVSIG